MPAIVYQQTAGALVPQASRTVATFTSGLVRVDQSFICPTTAEATHRASLAVGSEFPGDSTPALNGLKIFPDVQEIRRGDGFTEFRVSGYGSTTETGRNVKYYNKVFENEFIGDPFTIEPSDPLYPSGLLETRFALQEIRAEIVGALWKGQGVINLDVDVEVLDAQYFSASGGWIVETITNNFTDVDAEGSIVVEMRWSEPNSDGTPRRVRFTATVGRMTWVVEASREFGEIGEYTVYGSRLVFSQVIELIE